MASRWSRVSIAVSADDGITDPFTLPLPGMLGRSWLGLVKLQRTRGESQKGVVFWPTRLTKRVSRKTNLTRWFVAERVASPRAKISVKSRVESNSFGAHRIFLDPVLEAA